MTSRAFRSKRDFLNRLIYCFIDDLTMLVKTSVDNIISDKLKTCWGSNGVTNDGGEEKFLLKFPAKFPASC